MRKLFLLTLTIGLFFMGYSQERAPVVKELSEISAIRYHQAPTDPAPPMLNTTYTTPGVMKGAKLLGDEVEIMETVYDLQTNTLLSNRFWVWEDGTKAAVATRGMQAPAFNDRGTGYNFYDGSAWGPQPTERIESVRTGWPSIAPLGENGEIVASHMAAASEWYIAISKRETKGVGEWQESSVLAPDGAAGILWPRMTTGGENNNTVHMIALTTPVGNGGTTYQGQDGALLYYRSQDQGETWDIEGLLIEGLGSDYYTNISADDYAIAAKGETVVILVASAWIDLFILKSTDNGENWEKIIIWEHPYPFFDFDNTLMDDTLYSVDNSASLAIDNNNNVHVAWGAGRVARLAAAPPDPGAYSYWPYTDGIGYWNESMGQIPEADNPHHTMMPENLENMGMLIGWTQDVNNSGFIFDFEGTGDTPFAVYRSLGISTMPTIMIHENMIALAYASVTETFVTTDGLYNYHHIWTRFSYDLGETWGDFSDLQADNIFHLYDECIYPVFAPNADADGVPHLIYNADNIPGLHIDEDHDPVINRIIHNAFTFLVGIDDPSGAPVTQLNVSQNYPNPAAGTTQVTLELNNTADVSLELFNMTGQKVLEIPARTMQAGVQHISFDVSRLTSGVYFYTVTAGVEKATRKMIVN
jgi:hypothetical protein